MSKIFLIIAIVLAGVGFLVINSNSKNDIGSDEDKSAKSAMVGEGDTLDKTSSTSVASTPEAKINSVIDNKKVMTATLKTNKGDITIEFFDKLTPKTIDNFAKLAKSGFYNGVKFHRVIKGFMIQGGDPLSKDDKMIARWGTGGPGYTFEDEISPENRNDIGTISMANAGPDTNGSQFFINTKANNFLDTKHTVFGKVVSGKDVVTAIENTPTGENDRPVSPMVIESVFVN